MYTLYMYCMYQGWLAVEIHSAHTSFTQQLRMVAAVPGRLSFRVINSYMTFDPLEKFPMD